MVFLFLLWSGVDVTKTPSDATLFGRTSREVFVMLLFFIFVLHFVVLSSFVDVLHFVVVSSFVNNLPFCCSVFICRYSSFCCCSFHFLFDVISHPSVDSLGFLHPILYIQPSPSQSDSWHFHFLTILFLLQALQPWVGIFYP